MRFSRFSTAAFVTVATACALVLATPPQAARAQTLVVGGSNSDNVFPFGLYSGEYQQIYGASAFTSGPLSGSVVITKIAFASLSSNSNYLFTGTLGLGTTAATPGAPGTSFAANKQADFVTVFSGTKNASLSGTNTFDLVFDVNPFVYDPTQGNLLLDITTPNNNSLTGFSAGSSNDVGRLYNSNSTNFPNGNYGLRTQFTLAPAAVPEPGVWVTALSLAGTTGLGIVRGRRRSKTVFHARVKEPVS